MRILLLEGDQALVRCWRQAFELHGHALLPASTQAEARRILLHEDPALAIVELRHDVADEANPVRLLHGLRPALPIIAALPSATVELASQALAAGACDVLAWPVDPLRLLAAVGGCAGRATDAIRVEPGVPPDSGMAGVSPAMHELIRDLARATLDDAPVLIAGPSGVGKSLTAWMLHRHSRRCDGPFRCCDLRSMPPPGLLDEALLWNQLLGIGEGGTLVIDGADRLPTSLRARLAAQPEVRVVLIVDTGPDGRIDPGWLSPATVAHHIAIPPLRSRPEDIAPIARHLLQGLADRKRRALELATATQHALVAHAWPGNARELADRLAEAAERSHDGVILPRHLTLAATASSQDLLLRLLADACLEQGSGRALRRWHDRLDGVLLTRALERTRGNQQQASALLGLNRGTLRKRCRQLSLMAEPAAAGIPDSCAPG